MRLYVTVTSKPARAAVLAAAIALAGPTAAQASLVSVPELASYTLVYSLAIPNSASFNFSNVGGYSIDNHTSIAANSFSRIGYYLELQKSGGPLQYAFVSMNAFTGNAGQIGIPTTGSGAFFQRNVANMNVVSNVAGVVNGTGITTGSLEFWHTDYTQANGAGVAGASNSTYDFGDTAVSTLNYGSFQINNYGARQTIIGYNSWGGDNVGNSDLGIGNQATGNPDWTFAANAASYTIKNLEVYVLQDVPEPASIALLGIGLVGVALRRRTRPA